MGSGLFIAAAYGMNLENFIEETNYGFPLIISISTLTTILLFGYSVKHLNKLQKVTMMGEHYKSVRDNGF
ncbi:Mitochondrial inner membrane magnesium transporter LPE10 [Cyberlindnera fabianii]|nr:Mitochondrial inner membrane magnesium transporter LPE10 [Cyberlindnera fabianii]